MRFVIQCVDHAEVETDQGTIGKIGKGFLVLAGICESDTEKTADRMVEKMLKLRIFEDETLHQFQERSCSSLSLHYTQTAAKVIGRPLSKPDLRSMQRRSMNISFENVNS